MKQGPPTPEELPYVVAIRNAVEICIKMDLGRHPWEQYLETKIAETLRHHAARRQQERKNEWRRDQKRAEKRKT